MKTKDVLVKNKRNQLFLAQARAYKQTDRVQQNRKTNKTKQLLEPIVAVVFLLFDVPVGRPAPPPPMKLQPSGS